MYLLRALSLSLLLVLPSLAQIHTYELVPLVSIHRKLITDDRGLKQFAPWDVDCSVCKGKGIVDCPNCSEIEGDGDCIECKGKRRATCRACLGTKKAPDPLLELVCPSCWGLGWTRCGMCNGFGRIKEIDLSGNKRSVRCVGCRHKGFWKCAVCGGKRHIQAMRVKAKSLGRAKAKDLLKVRSVIQEGIAVLEAYNTSGNPSKVLEQLRKDLRPTIRVLGELGGMLDVLEEVLDSIHQAGSADFFYGSRLSDMQFIYKNRMLYLLQYEDRLLELYSERAEFNEEHKVPR